jgi:hypothetical protein
MEAMGTAMTVATAPTLPRVPWEPTAKTVAVATFSRARMIAQTPALPSEPTTSVACLWTTRGTCCTRLPVLETRAAFSRNGISPTLAMLPTTNMGAENRPGRVCVATTRLRHHHRRHTRPAKRPCRRPRRHHRPRLLPSRRRHRRHHHCRLPRRRHPTHLDSRPLRHR